MIFYLIEKIPHFFLNEKKNYDWGMHVEDKHILKDGVKERSVLWKYVWNQRLKSET